jgi:hypothetical protein
LRWCVTTSNVIQGAAAAAGLGAVIVRALVVMAFQADGWLQFVYDRARAIIRRRRGVRSEHPWEYVNQFHDCGAAAMSNQNLPIPGRALGGGWVSLAVASTFCFAARNRGASEPHPNHSVRRRPWTSNPSRRPPKAHRSGLPETSGSTVSREARVLRASGSARSTSPPPPGRLGIPTL